MQQKRLLSTFFRFLTFILAGAMPIVHLLLLPNTVYAKTQESPVIISEICFLPQSGKSEWIEIKNISEEPVNIAGWQVTNGKDLNIVLPKELAEMPPKAHVLIILDGEGDAEFSSEINDLSFDKDNLVILHTPFGINGNVLGDTEKGECALYAPGEQSAASIRAFVVWGHSPSNSKLVIDAVNAGLWQRKSDFVVVEQHPGSSRMIGPVFLIQPGGSIGLYNSCRGTQVEDWLVYRPTEVSPGDENPLPAPQLFLPPNGDHITSIEGPQSLTFSWTKLCGAAGYRFQLCEDSECAKVAIDVLNCKEAHYTAEIPFTNAVFYWRVQAIDSLGQKSGWSEMYKLIVGYPKIR